MRYPISPTLRRAAVVLIVVGALVAIAAIGMYFIVFGPQSGYRLSPEGSAWSNFGSYVGGVLGPIFSFFAFGGVLLTVYFQAKQLDASHAQANLEEIQRVLSNISTRIDGLLAQPPKQRLEHLLTSDAPVTIFTVISAAGTAALSTSQDYIIQATNEKLIASLKNTISIEVTAVGLELEQLTWCLQEYEKCGGSPTVVEFYSRRYIAVVCWLDAIGYLSSHHRVQTYFSPKDFRKFL